MVDYELTEKLVVMRRQRYCVIVHRECSSEGLVEKTQTSKEREA